MNYKLDEHSLLLTARNASLAADFLVVTVGFLIDSKGCNVLSSEAWEWLVSRFPGESFDRGLKKSVGTFAVQGKAFALNERQRNGMSVRARVGGCEKTLNVFPPRTWQQGLTGWSTVSTGWIDTVAIDLEHAFGGVGYRANPQGLGSGADSAISAGMQVPPIEHPAFPLRSPAASPPLASFLPLPPQCEERARYMGTLDAHWQTYRAPALPVDTDPRWFNEVAEDQCHVRYWQGDETWSVSGMHAQQGELTGALPGLRPRLFVESAQASVGIAEAMLDLDTVWLFPNDEYQLLLYRSHVVIHSVDAEDIVTLGVACEQRDDPVLSTQAWIDQLWPKSVIEPVVEVPPASPPLDSDAVLRTMQAQSDHIYDEILKTHQEGIEAAKKIAARVNVPFDPSRYPPPVRPDFTSAMVQPIPASTAPAAPFDPVALETGIRTSISAMQAQAHDQVEQIAKRFNRTAESLYAQSEALKAQHPIPRVDAASMVSRLPLSPAQKVEYQAGIESTFAMAKSVEGEISATVNTMLEQIAANSPQLPQTIALASPTVWTRELIEAAYAAAQPLGKQHFIGLDLSGIDLSKAQLEGTHFQTCQLLRANLGGAQLQSCLFTDSDLNGADLHHTQLHAAVFQRCRLDDAQFAGARLEALYATGCSLLRAQFAQAYLPQAQFVDCVLSHADMSGAELTGATFQDCSLDAVQAVDAQMSRSRFQACTLNQMQLCGADLHGASWSHVMGSGVNAGAANMHNLRLDQDCQLPGICLDQADMSCAGLNRSQLRGASLRETCLHKALISDCDLRDSDGYHLDAREANFTGSDLSNCRWPGANLMEARLRKVNLDKTDLSGSNLFGAVTEAVKGQDVQLARALLGRCRLKEDLLHV